MRNLVIGCAVAIAVLAVLVAVVAAVGYSMWSRAAELRDARERAVVDRHFYPVAHSASFPSRGTQVILSGVHPTRASENGRTDVERVEGVFFLDADKRELTLLEPRETTAPRPGARVLHEFGADTYVDADGSTWRWAIPPERYEKLRSAVAVRSPDGAWYAYVDHRRFEDEAALVLVDARGSQERVVARGLPKSGRTVFWSPDSALVFVYVHHVGSGNRPPSQPVKNAVYVARPDRDGLRRVWEEPEATKAYFGAMTYSPARGAVLFSRGNRLEAIDGATGAMSVVWQTTDSGRVGAPQVTPDGRSIGFVTDGQICVLDAVTGSVKARIGADESGARKVLSFRFAPSGGRIVYRASGPEDRIGGVDLGTMLPWSITNELLYLVDIDGTRRRQLADRHIGPEIVDVVER